MWAFFFFYMMTFTEPSIRTMFIDGLEVNSVDPLGKPWFDACWRKKRKKRTTPSYQIHPQNGDKNEGNAYNTYQIR
jgi:hypothetical protein